MDKTKEACRSELDALIHVNMRNTLSEFIRIENTESNIMYQTQVLHHKSSTEKIVEKETYQGKKN